MNWNEKENRFIEYKQNNSSIESCEMLRWVKRKNSDNNRISRVSTLCEHSGKESIERNSSVANAYVI